MTENLDLNRKTGLTSWWICPALCKFIAFELLNATSMIAFASAMQRNSALRAHAAGFRHFRIGSQPPFAALAHELNAESEDERRQSMRSANLSCCVLHEWPVFQPRGSADDLALAAFSVRRARAAGKPNSQIGLVADLSCATHQGPLRADSIKHCPHANAQPKVGNKQQIQPFPKLRSSSQRY